MFTVNPSIIYIYLSISILWYCGFGSIPTLLGGVDFGSVAVKMRIRCINQLKGKDLLRDPQVNNNPLVCYNTVLPSESRLQYNI